MYFLCCWDKLLEFSLEDDELLFCVVYYTYLQYNMKSQSDAFLSINWLKAIIMIVRNMYQELDRTGPIVYMLSHVCVISAQAKLVHMKE
jgi:hypothetical protein